MARTNKLRMTLFDADARDPAELLIHNDANGRVLTIELGENLRGILIDEKMRRTKYAASALHWAWESLLSRTTPA